MTGLNGSVSVSLPCLVMSVHLFISSWVMLFNLVKARDVKLVKDGIIQENHKSDVWGAIKLYEGPVQV